MNRRELIGAVVAVPLALVGTYTLGGNLSVPGVTIYSVRSGRWDDPGMWAGGRIPREKDTIVLGKDHVLNARDCPADFRCTTLVLG